MNTPATLRIDAYTKPGAFTARAIVSRQQKAAMEKPEHKEGQWLKRKIDQTFSEYRQIEPTADLRIVACDNPSAVTFLAGKSISG